MSRLFDAYLAIDWSASSKPGPAKPTADALWVGETVAPGIEDDTVIAETYWPTRHCCTRYIRARLIHHSRLRRRVFVGFDFAFGYPRNYARALGLEGNAAPWRLIWNELASRIRDDANNHNNRFEVAAALNARCGGATPGPLWGCPAGRTTPTLERTSPACGYPYPVAPELAIEKHRWADKLERGIQPVWKLLGSGSVGGQSLVGIPRICQLRDDPELAEFSRVWPFETGFTALPTPRAGPFILHGEIWPGIVNALLDPGIAIRDRAQVKAMVDWLKTRDTAQQAMALFDVPPGLSADDIRACVQEEGWIIGSGWRRNDETI